MCRICGRVVKCIFDTMPSRTYQVPSRRAFSTIRRTPITPARSLVTPFSLSRMPMSSITTRFSALSLTSQPRLPQVLPAILPIATSSSATQTRAFSASALMGAPRRTYNPSRRVQKRRHGYLARMRSEKGQLIIKRRQLKGRKYLTW